ncbi:MAG: SDR family NAD(P)-dependent oxidoreductase [Rhizomicrobium sp.]
MRNGSPRVVVITGAGAGVGRACALRFAKGGASLGLISRDEAALDDLARQVKEAGAGAVGVAAIVAVN